MTASSAVTLGAILLAGGRATRMGGVAKPLLEIDGRSMLERAIDACEDAGCTPITVVGPPTLTPDPDGAPPPPSPTSPPSSTPGRAAPPPPPHPAPPPLPRTVRWAREDPPFSGPAAAVVAALATWETMPEWSFVLACDLPRVDAAVGALREDMLLLPSDTDGVCLADASSRPQWLTGVYRTRALARAAAALPDAGRNASVRALLDDLAIAVVHAPGDITADVDTWEDLDRARARASDDERNRDD